MGFFGEFKKFITRGNVLDMAVGVIIGGAFGKIVSSLVSDLITPLISLATKGASLAEIYLCLNPESVEGVSFTYAAYPTVAAAREAGFATLNYGAFVQNIIDFLIIAFCIFCFVYAVAKTRDKMTEKKRAEEAAAAAAAEAAKAEEPPVETAEDILKDIRALLEKEKEKKE